MLESARSCPPGASRRGWIKTCKRKVSLFNFLPIVPPEVRVVQSRSPKFESKIASDTECSNFFSLYLGIKYLKYFVTAFHSTESAFPLTVCLYSCSWMHCTEDNIFIHSFALPLLIRPSLLAQPSCYTAPWTSLTVQLLQPLDAPPAQIKALSIPEQ